MRQLLRKARLLRLKERFRSVYVFFEQTIEERQAYKKVLQELTTKKSKVKQSLARVL